MLLAPVHLRLDACSSFSLRLIASSTLPTTSRRLPRARLDRLGEHAVAVGVEVLERRGPAARGRCCSAPGGWRSARRSRASRARCGGACSGPTASSVRMLCSRSASLIRMTRTSRAIASSILRKFSACASSCVSNSILSSLETPSTRSATGLPKLLRDLGLGDRGVLHHVVQQRGGQRLRVEVPLREDVGDGERVRDVGLARLAELPVVRGLAEVVGRLQLRDVLRLQVAGPLLEQSRSARSAWRRCRAVGDSGAASARYCIRQPASSPSGYGLVQDLRPVLAARRSRAARSRSACRGSLRPSAARRW